MNNTINTLYVFLQAGLGNRLFILASAYGIAKKNNYKLVLFNNQNNNTHSKINYFDTIFANFPIEKRNGINIINPKNIDVINEQSIDCFKYNEYSLKGDTLLIGFFQHIKNFEEYSSELIEYFTYQPIIESLKSQYPKLEHSYFIHLRRGDYVDNEMYVIDYSHFTDSVSRILSTDPGSHFYIISDDIEYSKKFFKYLNNKTFVESLNEVESLYLISLCRKGGVCSNSSFSWWGSYLNTNINKRIIFPRVWVNRPWNYIEGMYYPGVEYSNTLNNPEVLLLVYSCKSRIQKAEMVYTRIIGNIKNTNAYIVYGDKLENTPKIVNGKYIVLPVGDNYESLTDKSVELFKFVNSTFPGIKGCFKIDDDIRVNISHLNGVIRNNLDNTEYLGKKVSMKEYYSTHHYGKCTNSSFDIPQITMNTEYCAGPMYYLSKKALLTFDKEVLHNFYEDIAIGYHLTNNGISITDCELYSDIPNNNTSLHNLPNNNNITLLTQNNNNNIKVSFKPKN
jgi:hypothetical protein